MLTYTLAHAFLAHDVDQNPYPQLASSTFHSIQRHFATMPLLQPTTVVSWQKEFADQTSSFLNCL